MATNSKVFQILMMKREKGIEKLLNEIVVLRDFDCYLAAMYLSNAERTPGKQHLCILRPFSWVARTNFT